ncbi:Uncharacterised protein [Mycobacteroides abscessus subsp. abscessus]|nr:Uncharacterised protein [Mycobacteroides abscessus subsp. abscessus]
MRPAAVGITAEISYDPFPVPCAPGTGRLSAPSNPQAVAMAVTTAIMSAARRLLRGPRVRLGRSISPHLPTAPAGRRARRRCRDASQRPDRECPAGRGL